MDFRTDSQFVLVVDMSISKNNEVNIPIVKVESNSSVSTSVDRLADESSSTSSNESTSIEARQTQPTSFDFRGQSPPTMLDTDDWIIRVPSVKALTGSSFEGLTVPVTVYLDPSIPRTTYSGVTATGLTTRDLPDPCILQGEGADSDSSEELPKKKKGCRVTLSLKTTPLV